MTTQTAASTMPHARPRAVAEGTPAKLSVVDVGPASGPKAARLAPSVPPKTTKSRSHRPQARLGTKRSGLHDPKNSVPEAQLIECGGVWFLG